MPDTRKLIIVRNLNMWYDSKHALFDINLTIPNKSVTSLIGPSGCGKTSFLRCFNRMNDEIENCLVKGYLEVNGYNIYAPKVDVVSLRAKVGMVFQKPNPFPKSIYDNVAYGPKLHGINNKTGELDLLVEKSLNRVNLWNEVKDRLKESAMNLSGGQQQRLCIARAIAVKPSLLLMDEPCSALDPTSTHAIENLIQELKAKFTIIIVTHSIQQAKKISDTVVFFHSGKLVEMGPPNEVLSNPKSRHTRDYVLGYSE